MALGAGIAIEEYGSERYLDDKTVIFAATSTIAHRS
jgi:hypothetical protein